MASGWKSVSNKSSSKKVKSSFCNQSKDCSDCDLKRIAMIYNNHPDMDYRCEECGHCVVEHSCKDFEGARDKFIASYIKYTYREILEILEREQ